jgi:uncharacterized protein (UPF0261 family)
VRDRVLEDGCDVLLVDVGVLGEPAFPADVSRGEVAAAGGSQLGRLVEAASRGAAMEAMGRGAEAIVRRLHREGRIDGVLALGGSGGASIAARAMRALPLGVPKLLVSTVAAGDVRPYVGESDVTLMHSVVDVAGVNRISRRILANGAAAIAGMVGAAARRSPSEPTGTVVGATMFGVTTPCVTHARRLLEQRGYEVIVFSANGVGGRTMERLMEEGLITAALDVTTTELADELAGGILSAGPDRLETAGRLGLPQVVSLGALDVVNLGAEETVPDRYRGRVIHRHNPAVTLVRTTAGECAEVGRTIGRKLSSATGPCTVLVPLRGTSALAGPGQPFHDPEADAALLEALAASLAPRVELRALDLHVNDPEFAAALAEALHENVQRWLDLHSDHGGDDDSPRGAAPLAGASRAR